MNQHNHAPVQPAKFQTFLAGLKRPLPKSLVADFQKISDTTARLREEREAYSPEAARNAFDKIRKNASENPSAENLTALAAANLEEMQRKYAQHCDQVSQIHFETLKKARPVWEAICNAVLPIVDDEILNAESVRREQCEKYGVSYDKTEDIVILSLARYREVVKQQLTSQNFTPDPSQIVEWLGEICTR